MTWPCLLSSNEGYFWKLISLFFFPERIEPQLICCRFNLFAALYNKETVVAREFSRSRQCHDLANSLTFDLRASSGLWFADWHPQIFSMHQIIAGMLCSNTNDFKLFNILTSFLLYFLFPGMAPAIMVSRIKNIKAALLIKGPVLWEFDNAGVSVCVLFFWFCVFLCLCLYFWPAVGCVSGHVNCTEVCLTQPASSKMPIRARKHYEQRRCRAFILPKNAWKVNTKALNGT